MEVPKELNRRLKRIGGVNVYGEPNYRVVWGWSRLAEIGGRFEVDDEGRKWSWIGQKVEPKYGAALDNWHVEKWMPADSFGSPESWERNYTTRVDGVQVHLLGPYPSRGDYESIVTLPPISLNASACDAVAALVDRSRSLSRADRKKVITSKLDAKDRDWDREADAILDDAMPAFYGRPHAAGFHPKEKQ